MEQYNPPLSAIAKIISKHAAICALLLFLSMGTLFVFIALGIQNLKLAGILVGGYASTRVFGRPSWVGAIVSTLIR
jgi:hypothetical protein